MIDLFISKTQTDISTFERDGSDARTEFYRQLRSQTSPKGSRKNIKLSKLKSAQFKGAVS